MPFVTAPVEFEVGPRLRFATILHDLRPCGPRVGLPLPVALERINERMTLPMFRCIT